MTSFTEFASSQNESAVESYADFCRSFRNQGIRVKLLWRLTLTPANKLIGRIRQENMRRSNINDIFVFSPEERPVFLVLRKIGFEDQHAWHDTSCNERKIRTSVVHAGGITHLKRIFDFASLYHAEQTNEVFPPAYSFKDGYLLPGDAVGHGVDIDEELAATYPYKRAYLPVNRLADGSMCDW